MGMLPVVYQRMKQIAQSVSRRLGFTLVELLVVSTLILIFSSVVLIGYTNSAKTSRDKQREKDMHQVQLALEEYYETYHQYPTANSMSALLANSNFTQFMQNSQVRDPLNTGSYQYSVSSSSTTYQLGYTREGDQVLVTLNPVGQ